MTTATERTVRTSTRLRNDEITADALIARRPDGIVLGQELAVQMGADFIDYIVGDGVVTPPGSEAFYAEQIIRLPGAYQANRSYARPAKAAPDRAAHGLPQHAVVYACFNSGYKITPPVFDRWMAILTRVDHSVLWLLVAHPAARANLRSEARARGVDPDRLIFAGNLPFEAHLHRLRLMRYVTQNVSLQVNAPTTMAA